MGTSDVAHHNNKEVELVPAVIEVSMHPHGPLVCVTMVSSALPHSYPYPPPNLNWAQMQGDCESICDQRKSCYGGFTHHLEKALDAEDVSKEIVGHHVELLLGARGFEAVHLCERTRNGEQARGTAIQKHTPGCVHAKMYMCSASE